MMKMTRWAVRVGAWQPSEAEWTRAASLIQAEEKERIGKFYFKKDAKSSMVGRLLIRKFLCESTGLSNREVQIDRDAKGKPVFPEDPSILFNVSHQGDFAVLAGSSGCLPGQSLGVDVMKFEYSGGKTLDEFFRIMTRNFSPDEWLSIRKNQAQDQQLREFCRHWSLKESYVKATGTGITVNLQDLSFKTQSELTADPICDTFLVERGEKLSKWNFEECQLDSEHCVSIARNFDLPGGSFNVLNISELLSDKLESLTSSDKAYAQIFMGKYERP